MKEAFGIERRRDMDKVKRDEKASLLRLEVGDRVLVRDLNGRGGSGKTRAFWEQKVYKILEKKDEDGLVYPVQEESESTRTREAKRKEHQIVSNYLESTDGSSENEKFYFRPRFTRSQHQSLQREEDLQSSADILSDNSVAKSNRPGIIETITSSIKKKTFSQLQRFHLIMK